ncbi:MAG: CCA tRNA nucleotidyltransferase [Alphaproteobacteria bacterium]|nr:CCA tRNA nucleotidyltransferase [Alphaproteobacteria bacterium]
METQPWMTAPETQAVLKALTAKGALARFVGGCVRDALLNRDVHDVDIATTEPPESALALLKKAGIHTVPTGIAHGTVTAVVNHKPFEITTLRRDVETDGRHAKVVYTDNWQEDAARRDFTMNAVFCDPDGALYDFFDGIGDLHAGRVRFVGDAKERIQEDVLRLLRFFRFYAEYGTAAPDAEALQACREFAHLLPNLSGERVRAEMLRLLASDAAADVVRLMVAENILARLLPEATETDALAALIACEKETVGGHPVRRLAILLARDRMTGEAVGEIAARLKLSNVEKRRLLALVTSPIGTSEFDRARDVRRVLYGFGTERVQDEALLHWARQGEGFAAAARAALAEARAWQPVEFPLKGKDLQALGVPPGPEMGAFLESLEAWWIDGDFQASRAACLEKAKELVG